MNRGRRGGAQRAYGALSFEEEKHAILAKAHLALAIGFRTDSIYSSKIGGKSQREAVNDCNRSRQELDAGLADASAELLADKQTMLVVLDFDGDYLRLCSPELCNDAEVVLAACRETGDALGYASAEIQADRETVLAAVKLDGSALAAASEELRNDREVVRAALETEPLAFEFVGDELKHDRELVLETLEWQTKSNVVSNRNVLQWVPDLLLSDKEIVLEAIRKEGAAVQYAALELRQDKDFLVQAMRLAPASEQEDCFNEADESVHEFISSFEELQQAAASKLAVPGEHAPVLTIALNIEAGAELEKDETSSSHSTSSQSICSCEVTLLSGTSFAIGLSPAAAATTTRTATIAAGGAAAAAHSEQSCSGTQSPRADARRKRARFAEAGLGKSGPEQSQDHTFSLTVGDLAEIVLAELPKHTQAETAPDRIFIVFANATGSGEPVPATPWDWNRPLTDFA